MRDLHRIRQTVIHNQPIPIQIKSLRAMSSFQINQQWKKPNKIHTFPNFLFPYLGISNQLKIEYSPITATLVHFDSLKVQFYHLFPLFLNINHGIPR